MLVTCRYCGGMHQRGYICDKKPKPRNYKHRDEDIKRFRNSRAWQDKRIDILERDEYRCQCCARNYAGTVRAINPDNLSIHHAQKIRENWAARLDNDNLLTLCERHHKDADNGVIEAAEIKKIILEQEGAYIYRNF